MKKENKFRARDIHGNWHYGLISCVKDSYYVSNSAGKPLAFQVIKETIGQATGLYDLAEHEIYEGCVVEHVWGHETDLFFKTTVVYRFGCYGYVNYEGEVMEDFIPYYGNKNFEW